MRSILTVVFALLLACGPATADSPISAFACEPEWTALLEELAGTRVAVDTATTAAQDPHFIQARPSLIAQIRKADLLVCSGAHLEIGWLPLLLRRSGNRALVPGQPGYFLAAEQVRRLEVPSRIDRGEGDIHPQGNPHVHLNPHNVLRIARALSARLTQIDPAGQAEYQQRLRSFESRWQAAIPEWEARAAALRGMTLISHHRAFSYLADWLGLKVLATIEPKPGIPASGAHLAQLMKQFGSRPPQAIIRTPYEDAKPSLWLSARLSAPPLVLPFTVDPEGATTLFELFNQTIDLLLAANS